MRIRRNGPLGRPSHSASPAVAPYQNAAASFTVKLLLKFHYCQDRIRLCLRYV
jgi:hypothetical protein